jgi:hypothetical protein
MGSIPIIYQKECAEAGPKWKKLEIFLEGRNLTVKSVENWVETIDCGLKIGEFSDCWTY